MGIWSPNTLGSPVHPTVAAGVTSKGPPKPASAPSQAAAEAAARARIAAIVHPGGGSPIGSFLRHAASDVADTFAGLPSTGMFVAHQVEGSGARLYSYTGAPGSHAASKYADKRLHELRQARDAIAADYHARYGQAVKSLEAGHLGAAASHLGHAIYEHPGFVAGDVATLWSGAGAAARVASKAADVAGIGAAGGALRSAHITSIVPKEGAARPRIRATETLTDTIPGGGTHTVDVVKPPMSRNPLTRVVFQRPAAAAVRAIHQKLADASLPALQPLTKKGRINRVAGKQARVEAVAREGRRATATQQVTGQYASDLRALRSYVDKGLQAHPHEMVALDYHLSYPDLTVAKAQQIADSQTREIAQLKARPGPKVRTGAREANVAALQALIDHHPDLLSTGTAPQRLVNAVQSARAIGIDKLGSEAYGLTPKITAARAELHQRITLGGQRIVPNLRPERARLAGANEELRAVSSRRDVVPARLARKRAQAELKQANVDYKAAQRTGSIPEVTAARDRVAVAERAYQQHAGEVFSRVVSPAKQEFATLEASRAATAATLAPRLGKGRYVVATAGRPPARLLRDATRLESQAKVLRAVWEPVFRKEAMAVRAEKGGRFYPIGSKEHNAKWEGSKAIARKTKKSKGSGIARFVRPNEGPGGVYETVVERLKVHGGNAEALAAYQKGVDLESQSAVIRNALRPGFEEKFANPTEAARVMAPGETVKDFRARRARAASPSVVPDVSGNVATSTRGRTLAKRYFTPGEKPLTEAAAAVRTAAEREAGKVLGKAQKARETAAQSLERAKQVGDQASIRAASQQVTQASRDLRRAEAEHAAARSGYVGTPREIRAATRRVDKARARLRFAEAHPPRHELTPPNVPGYLPAPGAVYRPDIPADRMTRRMRGEFRKASARFTPVEVHKSLGVLVRTNDRIVDPRLLIKAVDDAHKAIGNRNSLTNLLTMAAYRDPQTGGIWVGRQAKMKAAIDPEHVALVDARGLENALQQGGDGPLNLDNFIIVGEPAIKALDTGAGRKMVALNRRAAEEWKAQLSAPSGGVALRGYDRILGLWKSAILTLAPRWYVHNTVGNSLQYALLAGPRDILAITRAKANHQEIRQAIQEAMPALEANFIQENMGLGMTAQALTHAAHAHYQAMTEAAFRFNNALEGVARRGAYIAAAKKLYRDEGVRMRVRPVRLGGMTDTEIAKLLRDMPTELKAEVGRQAELFLGNYSTFNNFERTFLKRVFPFYSWIRVISKLAVNLPVRHPLTAQFLAATSELAQPVENPLDPLLPWYQRGGIHAFGQSFGSSSTNPFGTIQSLIAPFASGGGVNDFITGAASGSESPLVQLLGNQMTGINQFTGRPFSAPPGFGGSFNSYGQEPQRINPSTGLPVPADHPTPGWLQGALSMLPVEPIIRGGLAALAGGNKPYDTAGDLELLKYLLGHGQNPVDLFQPQSVRPKGVISPLFWSQLASYFGAPLQNVDAAALQQQADQRSADAARAMIATVRARALAAAKLGVKP